MPFEIVIEPTKGLSVLRFREIWEFRELFYFLVWRDIKIRYKQTFLGAAWALIRPLMGMVVFTVLFNKLVGFSVQGVPYLLFTFCGVVAWNFFSEGVVGASQSLLANANLISKVYFPRVIIPAAAILSGLVDFSIAFILAIVLMVYFQFMPTATILLLPFFILLTILTSLGIGFWFSSISVRYRISGTHSRTLSRSCSGLHRSGMRRARFRRRTRHCPGLIPSCVLSKGFAGRCFIPGHSLCIWSCCQRALPLRCSSRAS